jgi:hypothetical protein
MARSDFSCPCIIGYGSSPSRCGPARQRAGGRTWGLPVPAQGASAHASVYDHAGPSGRSRYRAHPCCLPSPERRRRPARGYFRGSMAGLCDPLSMLRRCPRGQLRMTRGRCGSLLLHRDGLAPSTPCRSPGALRITPESDCRAEISGRLKCARFGNRWGEHPMTFGVMDPSWCAPLRLTATATRYLKLKSASLPIQ